LLVLSKKVFVFPLLYIIQLLALWPFRGECQKERILAITLTDSRKTYKKQSNRFLLYYKRKKDFFQACSQCTFGTEYAMEGKAVG